MADARGQYQKLPPGWDCKYDQATGNCYYVNYFTKAMQLEDPRARYKQLQNERCSTESIAMQPVHGSPYHVYPSNNLPAMRAFQAGPGTNTSLHNMSSSPLLSSRGNLEISPLPLPRSLLTQTPRLGNMSRRSTIQETSFTNPIDTDAVVNKIQNMFPTASEDHIRLLLKKYYNREAVVISALQVEKHPVTMPGPYVTPPAQRHLYHSNSAFHMTPPARRLDRGMSSRNVAHFGGVNGSATAASCTTRTGTPTPGGRFGSVTSVHGGVGGGGGGGYMAAAAAAAMPFHQGSPRFEQWRSSPKPHSSPKMKLRYMKTIFPKADEMVLLDILASSDNNVQTASEKLISMGYTKRDFIPPKTTHRFDAAKKPGNETIIPLRPKEYTTEEKATIHAQLKEKYPQIAERIILMALESVNYAEDRAVQILHIVQEEDELQAKKHSAEAAVLTTADAAGEPELVLGTSEMRALVDDGVAEDGAQEQAPASDTVDADTASKSATSMSPSKALKELHISHDFSSASSSVPSSLTPSSGKYQTITTKSILSRSNLYATGIQGYLHGKPCCTANSTSTTATASAFTTKTSASILENLKLTRLREKHDSLKALQQASADEGANFKQRQEFKSIIERIATTGHCADLAKGADESLLLADYVTWNGANPDMPQGNNQRQLVHGPDVGKLNECKYKAVGRNAELCKGAQKGLAKGSIYAQLAATGNTNTANIKCN
ncbi:uncharacterized protein LOC129242471 isoform X2 [Anastrepha obliqua]|uniref:uncharacterized protein LOC129242471 isoform X2 n=1 Tax=Anastrepha obliqua TaxID=95512 RepID=UPI002409621E|nr:uncharacterized protein LOC129242471 isoform X2 [Anastrepha obliqua]